MYTGEIHAIWLDIRPKEHRRTRQKTSLTEVQEKFRKAGVNFVEGYLAVVDPRGLRPSGEVGDTPKWEQQLGVLTLRQGTRQRGG